jgi:hypothetical protein
MRIILSQIRLMTVNAIHNDREWYFMIQRKEAALLCPQRTNIDIAGCGLYLNLQ